MWVLPYPLETRAEIAKDEMMWIWNFLQSSPGCAGEVAEGMDEMSWAGS